ncbi:TetR/AcrR family transcriptional regulator [Pontibacter ruber]|uniref:TetR/AcrR family transcriptional regulator n=1 Tax=Pontibacter ruber TaxID=1343895 RepID=A0ABW5CYG6_9BACT|nr:TetR/AcrR family transcriptional regulator [Pontibacter ruber]
MQQSTEEKILAAAAKVFMEKGMAGARMQDIADEAGINKALLHYYFRSKEKLFDEIFKEVSGQLLPRLNQIIESDISLFDKIWAFCQEYISRMVENPYLPLFIVEETNKQQGAFLERHLGNKRLRLDKLAQQVQQEVARGTIKPIHPLELFLTIISMCAFPFLGKPLLQHMSGMNDDMFNAMMEARKSEVPKFIINAIKK